MKTAQQAVAEIDADTRAFFAHCEPAPRAATGTMICDEAEMMLLNKAITPIVYWRMLDIGVARMSSTERDRDEQQCIAILSQVI